MKHKGKFEETDLYLDIKNGLSGLIPTDVREVIREVRESSQGTLWVEIGKTLNSFPITEEVDKFKLREKIEPFMYQNNISDLDLDKELTELKKRGYVTIRTGSRPNYFLGPTFAKAIEFIKIFEDNLIVPLVEELGKNPKYKDYEDLRKIVESATLYAVE